MHSEPQIKIQSFTARFTKSAKLQQNSIGKRTISLTNSSLINVLEVTKPNNRYDLKTEVSQFSQKWHYLKLKTLATEPTRPSMATPPLPLTRSGGWPERGRYVASALALMAPDNSAVHSSEA